MHRFVKKPRASHPLTGCAPKKLLNSALYRFGGGYSKVSNDDTDARLPPALSGELAYGVASSAALAGFQLAGAGGGYLSPSELRSLMVGPAGAITRTGHQRPRAASSQQLTSGSQHQMAAHAKVKMTGRGRASSGEVTGDPEEVLRRLDDELALLTLRDGQAQGRCAVGCAEARRAARLTELSRTMRQLLREAMARYQQAKARMLHLLSARHAAGRQQASEVPLDAAPPPKVGTKELARRVMARVSGLDRARLLEAASTSDLRQLLRMKTLMASPEALEKIYQFVYTSGDVWV